MAPIFPGMDPYLEAAGVWPGFHEAFLSYTREALQPLLPEGYYAELRTREEIGIAGYRGGVILYPDVSIQRAEDTPSGPRGLTEPARGAGLMEGSNPASEPDHLLVVAEEPLQVAYLEVRSTARGERLVTVIELLSPSNKLPGPDREAFERKQSEILSSPTSWVQIDLLRTGSRVACHPSAEAHCQRKGYDYLVTVSRSSRRTPALDLELYGFRLCDSFPVVGIPLEAPDADVPLDLQKVFLRAFETGPYRKILRYDRPSDPPLDPKDAAWAATLLREKGIR